MSTPEVVAETVETVRGIRKWLSEQTFTNILLLLLLITIAFVSMYTVAVAIPSYEEAHRQERAALAKEHKDERKELAERYERWVRMIAGSRETAALEE